MRPSVTEKLLGHLLVLAWAIFLVIPPLRASALVPAAEFHGTPLPLSNWIAIGPFKSGSDQEALDQNYLSARGIKGDGASAGVDLASLLDGRDMTHIKPITKANLLNFFYIYNLKKEVGQPLRTFYVETKVLCAAECTGYLLVGSDGILKIWINGKPVSTVNERRGFGAEEYTRSIPVSLERGENRLLIKVARVIASCGLVAELIPTEESLIDTLLIKNGSFLKNLVIGTGQPLAFELRGGPQHYEFELDVTDAVGRSFGACTVTELAPNWQSRQKLAGGLYYANVAFNGKRRREGFLVGKIDDIAAPLIAQAEIIRTSDESGINFRTLTRRMAILLDPKNRKPNDREWQRKVVYTVDELSTALRQHEAGENPWLNRPGLHLRGFRSQIDGQERHYRLFVPESYRPDRPLPLAIMVATTMSASRPFLESSFVAHQMEAERFSQIAEACGIGILWPGYPAEPYGNLEEYTHFDEVMAAVGRDYTIDHERLYLMGTCRAGMIATMMVERWPGRFAALGMLDPIMNRIQNRQHDQPSFLGFDAYRKWLQEKAPLNHLKRLANLPMYVVFDGENPEHGTIDGAIDLVSKAESIGFSPKFAELPTSLDHMTGWGDLINWIAVQRRPNWSNVLSEDEAARERAVGPVARAFAERFVMVEATGGSDADREACGRISRSFQEAWLRTLYGSCRVTTDSALTAEEERSSNLVLIGNAETNKAWARLAEKLPVRLKADSIAIDGRIYQGKDLSIQGVVVHPEYPGRRIVFIGSANPETAVFGTQELALDGWFDYAIWRNVGGKAELTAAERSAP
jgi:pimeloyl-ACP methyl ester carboxylesterase